MDSSYCQEIFLEYTVKRDESENFPFLLDDRGAQLPQRDRATLLKSISIWRSCG